MGKEWEVATVNRKWVYFEISKTRGIFAAIVL